MLQFLRSLLKQSNPSIRTAAGLCPNFIRAQPPAFREDGDGGVGDTKPILPPLPNCSSWITGFEALLGGDPQKYGGDEATWLLLCSSPLFPPCHMKNDIKC
ncbi:hypothetical protein TorRG33x02_097500 [Trema orientale]|uniref:Uncharacterized protein n=1 Tax=Trema orientale TaxID=63057 RepID=A0A2P5F9P1_TREOI|nr:hypothetical protein TorRG33x02_097500 [Trema orientale]